MLTIISSLQSADYEQPGHPESPDRIITSYTYLKGKEYTFIEPTACSREDLLLVHTKEHVEKIMYGEFFDMDTPNHPRIYDYACLSAGAAMQTAELALDNTIGFSLMRPPGHHAGRESVSGFCYFNNLAVATEAVARKGKKVAIIDFDCHHGQGTQEIFLGREDILYFSLHQIGIYPGTGHESIDNAINVPLQAGTQAKEYMRLFMEGLQKVKNFNPDILAVSAGFDTYIDDPITTLNLVQDDFKEIGTLLKEIKLPMFAVLEGGYSSELPQCIEAFLQGLNE